LRLTAVIAHDGPPAGPRPLLFDPEALAPVPVIGGDVATGGLHDPDKLAAVLKAVL